MKRKAGPAVWKVSSIALITLCLILVSVSGAAEKKAKKGKKGNQAEAEYLELMWPEPPLTPRIKFVDLLASELDAGRKITFKESFMQALTGKKTSIKKIYQPLDIAVSDDGRRVYSSDFAASVVFVFDFEAQKMDSFPMQRPFGLALDAQENLYVVEQGANQISVLNRAREQVRSIKHPSLIRPTDIVLDEARNRLYVADPATKYSEDHSVKVFDLQGNLIRTVGNGKGECEGCLYFPTYVAVDSEGNVYVTSTMNARVDVFDSEGTYTKTIGTRGASYGQFDKPKGVGVDSFGNIYVVDSGWSNIQIFNQKGQVLLFFGGRGSYPGLLKNPTGIHIAKDNRIYVADYLNYRVTVYQLVNTKAEDSYISLPAAAEDGEGER